MKTQIEPLLTVSEVASLLHVSRPQVYRLLKLGLPSIRLHERGDLRFDLSDVIQFIEGRKVGA